MPRLFVLFSFFIFHFSPPTYAQNDSCHIRISLLTCTPGADLYSTFGHSALRVTDTVSNSDIVYNYGTFNFEEPGFYTKFIRGKLLYYLSTEDLISFAHIYKEDNRGITEQVLNLTCSEKRKFTELLQINMLPKNRGYKYDFLFDNCTTRLRDLLEKAADSSVRFGEVVKGQKRFRELIYEYLDSNDQQWSKLGIDALLGAKTDAVMDNRQVMFLPDYLMRSFDSSHIGNKPVVQLKQNLYELNIQKRQTNIFTDPLFLFWSLLILIIVLSFIKNISVQQFLPGFDGFFFFLTGMAGLLMLIMWFATEHLMTKNNYNLLWAWPTHAIAAFYMYSKKLPVKRYFQLAIIIDALLIISWFYLPQHLNTAFIPVVLLLIFRSTVHAFSINRKIVNGQ